MEDEGPMVKIKGTQAEQKVKLKERVETLDKALKHKITNLDGYDRKVIEIQTLMFKVSIMRSHGNNRQKIFCSNLIQLLLE